LAKLVYDANGNTISDPTGKSYSWDFENRLTQAVVPGTNGGTTTFKYDPFGRRIEKVSPSFTSIFVYDGPNLIQTMNGTGGPRFLHTPQRERVPRPCVFCKGGYDAVCSMRVSCSQKRQRRLLWYPPFAKYAKDGHPLSLLC